MVARHFSFSNLAAELDKIASDQFVFETKSFAFACFVWGFSATNCQSLLQRYHLPIGRVTIAQECLEFFIWLLRSECLNGVGKGAISVVIKLILIQQQIILVKRFCTRQPESIVPKQRNSIFLWYVVSVQASKIQKYVICMVSKSQIKLVRQLSKKTQRPTSVICCRGTESDS